ncbi:MAG: hypothetical protein AAF591_09485 [Verrucomicrobiota bacterium]
MKRIVLAIVLLSAAAFPLILSGCAMNDPENWERTNRGLSPHPDDDPTERRTR